MSSLSDKLSGKAKQTVGDATGNDKMKNEGKLDEAKGKVKDALSQGLDAVKKKVDKA